MKDFDILTLFAEDKNFKSLINHINNVKIQENIFLKNLNESQKAILAAYILKRTNSNNK